MKTKVAIEKGTLLWSVSEVVSSDANERLGWTNRKSYSEDLLKNKDITVYGPSVGVVNSMLVVPVYMIVTAIRVRDNLYPAMKNGERNSIVDILFFEDFNDTVDALKSIYKGSLTPHLFIYNDNRSCFERVNFKTGRYFKHTEEDSQTLIARDFEFEHDLGADFDYFEDYDWDEIDSDGDFFVEIPDFYEITSYSEGCPWDYSEKDLYVFRNLKSIVDEALINLIELDATEVVVDGSFARYIFLPDWDEYRARMGLDELAEIEYAKVDYFTFSKCVTVEVIYRYEDTERFSCEEDDGLPF